MSGTLDKTIARAEGFLKRFRDKPVAHLIDGKQDSGHRRDVRDALADRQFGDRASRARRRGRDRPRREGGDQGLPHRLGANDRR